MEIKQKTWEEIEACLQKFCSIEDVYKIFTIKSKAKFTIAVRKRYGISINEFIERQGAIGRMILLQAQFDYALANKPGSGAMLKFLGKQHLNQAETVEILNKAMRRLEEEKAALEDGRDPPPDPLDVKGYQIISADGQTVILDSREEVEKKQLVSKAKKEEPSKVEQLLKEEKKPKQVRKTDDPQDAIIIEEYYRPQAQSHETSSQD